MAHSFTRVTLVGSRKHIDLLLPSNQPVVALLPQVLTFLDDPPTDPAAAKVLVTADGTELRSDFSLSQANVLDGSSLLLCNAPEAPPPAVVYDVTDLVAAETAEVSGHWTERHRVLAGSTFAAAGTWAGAELLLAALAPAAAWWVLLALSVAGLGLGAAAGHPPRRSPLSPALLTAGWLTAAGAVRHLHDDGVLEHGALAALALAGLSVLGLAAAGHASASPRILFCCAGTLAALSVVWTFAAMIAGNPVHAGALGTLGSILLLGLLPQLALSASGLSALDDQRARGGSLLRANAMAAVAAAHHSLVLGTAVTAASVALGLGLLGTDPHQQQWSLPLLLALTLAVFLRARAFPLARQRYALYLATAFGVCALTLAALRVFTQPPWIVGAGVVGIAAGTAVCLALPLPEHLLARFRLLGRRLETVAVLATVPLTAGLFGIFHELLRSFP